MNSKTIKTFCDNLKIIPKKESVIIVRLSKSDKELVCELSKKSGVCVSDYIRRALAYYVEHLESTKKQTNQ